MDLLPGTGGVLRYTDDDQFGPVEPRDWWPDDHEDFKDHMRPDR